MKKRKISIGIDVDGVLRDFAYQFTKYAREVRGVQVEVEDYNTWGFPNVRDAAGRKVIVDVFANPTVGQYVYENAPMVENAYTGYRMFIENPNIDVYIVTSQKKGYENFTIEWLKKNNFTGFTDIFFEQNKLNAPVQVLIDDKVENVIKFNQNKRDSILVNQPYNVNVDLQVPIPRVDDMIEAYNYLKKRYSKYL